ncbi:precorrin-6y C5,15-methyltransferase (decarboxylating) subunit CbiE [Streptomyces sp. NPDC018045]|uniref:precorrin-6y C5,15-methyltransferase (decarboxylating) subunit CbiE n=1 Tax=Streptomyces sp. NPDC018045 TaxID=3365037 RepID=UPI0037BD5C25
MSPAPPAAPPPRTPARVTVVGIGADGWDGLPAASQEALRRAGTLVGGARQLALLPAGCAGERVPWPSPLRPAVPGLLAAHAGREVCVLASGDPMFHGIGRTLAEVLAEAGAAPPRVLPHPSSVSYACARLGWPVEDTEVITLVGRPLAGLAGALHDGRRLLVLSAGAETPAQVAGLLRERGFGPTRIRVLEQLGGPRERQSESTAAGWPPSPATDGADPLHAIDPLNVIALDCVRAPDTLRLSAAPGLPDDAYEHDGQLTKRHVRAATLAALAPAPGELLWDVGGGSGSIGIEWMRTHRACRAVAVERDAVRAGRITRNADALGVPALRVVTGRAPEALAGLPAPDAVFIGGGLTAPGLLEACWAALPPGGRLVANTVTLESEALLADWYRRYGGDLVRLAVAHAVPVGGFTGWRQAMPVTQWSVTKGLAAEGPAVSTEAASTEAASAEAASAEAASASPGPAATPHTPAAPTAPGDAQ